MCGLGNEAPSGDPVQKCAKLKYVLSYSAPKQGKEGGKEGGREENANLNVVPWYCANMGTDGQRKALGGHPFFMRFIGSKANILFFKRKEKQ